jgi:hypothetical protein
MAVSNGNRSSSITATGTITSTDNPWRDLKKLLIYDEVHFLIISKNRLIDGEFILCRVNE